MMKQQTKTDPLSIASMPRAELDRLARELAAQHPALARRILGQDFAETTEPAMVTGGVD